MTAFDGVSDEVLVAEARALLAEADKIEKEAETMKERASREKWDVADRCHALSERGWGTRKIGEAIGVSHRTAGVWTAMVERYLSTLRPVFGEAYIEVFGSAGKDATYERHARAFLKTATPEKVADIIQTAPLRAKVSQAQQIAYDKVERKAERAFRESVGDETADNLDREAVLRDAEIELFKARRSIINTLRKISEAGSDLPDAWREDFLRTVDDVDLKVSALRDLLTGMTIDDLDRLLEEV